MADQNILIDSTDIVVTGGPATVTTELDFGTKGERGGLILYGLGQPTESNQFEQTPQLLDWYINLKSTDSEYLYIYQYISSNGIVGWNRVFRIIPNTYSVNNTVTFVGGSATTSVKIGSATLPLLAAADQTHVSAHIDIQNSSGKPVASSFVVQPYTIDENGDYNVPIILKAAELSSGTWINLDDPSALAHITINVI